MLTKESYTLEKSESVFPKNINMDKLKKSKGYISTRYKELLSAEKATKHHLKKNTIEDRFHILTSHPLQTYSGNASTNVNRALIRSVKTKKIPAKHKEFIDELDNHLNDEKNALRNDAVVYSGISSAFSKKLSSAKPGQSVHFPAYTSASIDRDRATSFAKNSHILVFHLPKGYNKGRYIENLSLYAEEKEMTLARNQKFKYLDRRVHHIKDKWGGVLAKYVYHHLKPI